jgi:cytochrome c1
MATKTKTTTKKAAASKAAKPAAKTKEPMTCKAMVEAYIERIEITPETNAGVVILAGGLENAYREGSTRLPIRDMRGCFELAFYGWKEGAAHQFLGPNNATDL